MLLRCPSLPYGRTAHCPFLDAALWTVGTATGQDRGITGDGTDGVAIQGRSGAKFEGNVAAAAIPADGGRVELEAGIGGLDAYGAVILHRDIGQIAMRITGQKDASGGIATHCDRPCCRTVELQAGILVDIHTVATVLTDLRRQRRALERHAGTPEGF